MRALLLCLLTLSLSLPASAERLQRFGELEVHYSVFNSTFLQPDIAAASGLERSKQRGVINIALRKGSQAQAGTVSGQVRNLLGQRSPLTFREQREGEAFYYLAQFTIDSREQLVFELQVQGNGGPAHTLTFTQEVFAD